MPENAKTDKVLTQVRKLCLAYPEAKEVEAWGHPTFRAGKKMFAAYGDDPEGPTLGIKVGFERQEELLRDSRFFPTPYAAHQGWVSIRISKKADWGELDCLLELAYRQVALKRMLAALDAERSGN
jgi:predicted DNA-binding protein (MmcQ/YjbR family)